MRVISIRTKIAIAAVFCSLVVFFGVGAALVWAQGYDGRLGPNTFVGTIDVSGMDPEEAARTLRGRADALYASGVTVTLDGESATMPLTVLAEGDSFDLVRFHVEESVDAAYAASRGKNGAADTIALLTELAKPNRAPLFVSADEEQIRASVRAAFPGREVPPVDAAFAFTRVGDAWTADVTDGTPGEEFDFEPFMTALLARLSALDDAPVRLALTESDPQVTRDEAVSLTDDAVAALARAPYALTLDDGRSWIVTGADLASMLVPFREMGPVLDVDEAAFDAFVDPIAAEVETEARNARFSVDGGRVSEFVGSQDGLSVNRGELKVRLLAAARGEGEAPIIIPTSVVEPDVTTEEANDLGITDVLGVGTSSYRGSPANRVKNIRNGVNLLNGLLIAPDETFSLLAALKPFETDNGYLPELVIKGDKIQPEIGGGLCQIGTTSFRAAMNSGLPVVQRSNHSLVVSYYNDPSNGNPGTDATIYDPAPDFQFKNDTGRYVLFQAEMNEDDASLAFTLWGTSDGRIGSYTPPEVTRWIGVGETVRTETLDLEPGVTKCQSAHVGADTTFTYRVVKTDGSVEERTFESHYRPLPEICLVGVEELSTRDDLPADADGVSSTQATDVPVEADDALPPAAQTETE
jgi:vancomycin resistance protein YoaR